jgi:hypothetical protein
MSDCRLFASSAPISSRGGHNDDGLMVVGGSMQKKKALSTVEVFDGINWQIDSNLPLPHPGVNFINVIRTNFSYKHCFSSYVLVLSKKLYEKFVRRMLMKLTAGYK